MQSNVIKACIADISGVADIRDDEPIATVVIRTIKMFLEVKLYL